jgi:hypothetical protein
MPDKNIKIEDILNKLRQKTALSESELHELQTAVQLQESTLAGSHHFAISHHGIAVQDQAPGVLERK